jgi:nucleotide-binding universal stress UspA family protein
MSGAPGPVVLVPWDYEEFGSARLTKVAIAFVDTPDGLAAVGTGRAVATSLGASVELVTVLPDTRVRPSVGEPARFAAAQKDEFAAAVRDEAQPGEGVRLLDGPVVDALADLRPEDVDLLVCGSRGYGPARRVLLGGVSARLLRHARVPVMVVPRP